MLLLFQEWPVARKYKTILVPNMDMYEAAFGAVTVTGAEGWSAQQGEASLDSRADAENVDESDSVDIDMSVPREETQNKAASSRSKRKRTTVDPIVETCAARNEILTHKNKLVEQMLERDQLQREKDRLHSVEHVLEILNGLPGVIKWSQFHSASVDHHKGHCGEISTFIGYSEKKT
ncbi:unnamed protein product [Cochlearia groenlandica]